MWMDLTNDTFDWTRRSGSTSSGATGPSGAMVGTHYLYIEVSSPRAVGDTAELSTAPLLFASATQLTFGYHMYGSTMGSLVVKVGGTSVWSKAGNQGNSWNTAAIDLTSMTGQTAAVEFIGTRGTSYTGDIAIDEVAFGLVPTQSPTTQAPTPQPTTPSPTTQAPTPQPTTQAPNRQHLY